MKHKAARREVLSAIAEFEQACLQFSEAMQRDSQTQPFSNDPSPALALLRFGLRKPAKRAPRHQADQVGGVGDAKARRSR